MTSQSGTNSGTESGLESETRTKNFFNKFYGANEKEEETTLNGSELKSAEEEIMMGVSPSEKGSKVSIFHQIFTTSFFELKIFSVLTN
jgi:hypothetical protein